MEYKRAFVSEAICSLVIMKLFVAAVTVLLVAAVAQAVPFLTRTAPPTVNGIVRGDIILTPEQDEYYFGKGRTGLLQTNYRWEGNVVYYAFTDQNEDQKRVVREALADMEQKLCLRFVERTNEPNYIYITRNEPGCWSYVGRIGGAQQMNLDLEGCYQQVVVQHEFIHALGFFHMQSASDRDNYLIIHWDNIIPGYEHNFDKVNEQSTYQFGEPYDYFSIMHYPGDAFSRNGYATMEARDPDVRLDYRWDMTETDISRIRNMYCPN